MAKSPALLLLLALGLCEYGYRVTHHLCREGQISSSTTHLRVGQRLQLECRTPSEDSSVTWVRLDRDGTLHFIVFISSLSRTTFKGNKKTSTRFEAWKNSKVYHLVVKSFAKQDEGNYFCLINSNYVLYFSPGQPAFFPVTTTVAPTTPAPTTQGGVTQKDPCLKTSDPETSKEKELNFFCDIFIWIPLAGACLLLLSALAITIMLRQRKTR
ncbi:CD8A protein, partial [Ardeotis kori]|nr:CD8A protein [Ardeotis kori]